ncbi:MAG: response regulator transcription factor [Planctomycetes bacterium]|nr:response regulator transcription factor [Planctomycetota bacterium]
MQTEKQNSNGGAFSGRDVVLVEDERDIADLLKHNLTREGYRVRWFGDGRLALAGIERDIPDAIILDLMLPGIDGLEVCRQLRRSPSTARVPIVILTARGDDTDHVAGLEVGADDYVTKPVSPRVLVARLRALLRRSSGETDPSEVITIDEVRVDAGRHEVSVEGKAIHLTHKEFQILQFLAVRPGRVRSRSEIVDIVSGGPHVLERTIDVHMAAIRRKLGKSGRRLETVIGVGYRLRDESRAELDRLGVVD